jgi:hypothetical protein
MGAANLFSPDEVSKAGGMPWPATNRATAAFAEAHGLARGDGNFGARARIAPNTGLAWPHVEDAKAPQLDPLTLAECALHTLKDRFDGHLGLGFGDSGPVDNFVDDIELDQGILLASSPMRL